jgi:hypothetical protein
MAVPALSAGQVRSAGQVSFTVPDCLGPALKRLVFELRDRHGNPLAANHLDLAIYPARRVSPILREARLFVPLPDLAGILSALGYALAENIQAASAVITDILDGPTLAYLAQGGRVLLLADRGNGPETVMPTVRRIRRAGTLWCGDWASSFTWLNRRGALARFPGGPLIDHSFDRVIPDYILTGFREWEFASLVQAGMFVGWVHKPAVVVGERYYGEGKAVLNAFHLADEDLGSDPTATNLLDELIERTLC